MISRSEPTSSRPAWVDHGAYARLERFLVGPELGRGAMGCVHEVWDPILNRRAAMKLLLKSDAEAVLRLLQEARRQARLEHPGICRVYEVGAEFETPYILMELVVGQRLGDLFRNLTLRELVQVMAQIAEAVHAAHEGGVIHRDLKPSNIMVTTSAEGSLRPVVLDFGLATDLSMADRSLSCGIAGTPAFMSPEQVRGEQLTPASDVYSLGATLFSLIKGYPPFEAVSLAGLIAKQSMDEPPSLRARESGIPQDLETLVQKCLEPQPNRRYASARDLAEDLGRFLEGAPLRARPLGVVGRLWRRARRHQALSLTLAASVLAVGILGGVSLRERHRSAKRVVLAQGFGKEISRIDSLMRIERLLPAHDLRPALGKVRKTLAGIEQTMAELGAVAQGPGHAALGLGHLALRDFPVARRHLEKAWALGERDPATALALGRLLADAYLEARWKLGDVPADDPRVRTLMRELRDPALQYLGMGRSASVDSPSYPMALIAFCEGRFEDAVRLMSRAQEEQSGGYELKLMEARALIARSFGLRDGVIKDDCLVAFDRAMKLLDEAALMGRSDEAVHAARAQSLGCLMLYEGQRGRPTGALLKQLMEAAEAALRLQPDDRQVLNAYLGAVDRYGFCELYRGRDPRDAMRAAIAFGEARLGNPEVAPVVLDHLTQQYLVLAEHAWVHGGEPLEPLRFAEAHARHHLRLRQVSTLPLAEVLILRTRVLGGLESSVEAGDRAIEAAKKGVEGLPDMAYAHSVLGEANLRRAEAELIRGGDPSRWVKASRESFQRGIEKDPLFAWTHVGLAEALLLESRSCPDPGALRREALSSCDRGLRSRSDHYHGWLIRAKILMAMGKVAEAEEAQRKGLMAHPRHPALLRVISRPCKTQEAHI